MKKKFVVKKAQDFDDIINRGYSKKNSSFAIYYKNNDIKYDRYGISVGKKLGNAVFRNKYKRKIRAIVDNYKKDYVNTKDYIIILRRSAVDKNFQELTEDFNKLMHSIGKESINEKEKNI